MILFAFLICSLAAGLLTFQAKSRRLNRVLSLAVILLQTAVSAYAVLHGGEPDSLYFRFDALGILFSLILSALLFTTYFHSGFYLKSRQQSARNESIFSMSLIFLTASMECAYFADHGGVLWACIEATTLSVAALIYHERTSASLEATWKYLFVSSIGLAIAFTGILILAMAAHEQGVSDLKLDSLVSAAPRMNPVLLKIAFLLIFTGYGAKIGLFPLHAAAVDAKTVTPYQINGLISTALVNVGFAGVMRILTILSGTDSKGFAGHVLLLAGIVSLAAASFHLLKVRDFKRMFAFSTLEHTGIISIALASGGFGIYAAVYHLLLHSFAKASVFYQLGQIHRVYGSYTLEKTGRFLKLNPAGALILILSVLTINAIPPSGLFITEFMIFKSLFRLHLYWQAVLVMILITVIVFVLFSRLCHLIYAPSELEEPVGKVHSVESAPQVILLGLVMYLVIDPPGFITQLIGNAALAMGGIPWQTL